MPRGKIPRYTFDPLNLLDERELPTMSAEMAIQQIQRLTGDLLPNMSAEYYVQKVKAISILADIAANRLGNKQLFKPISF